MHIGVWMQNPDARILHFLRSQRFVRFPALSTFITFSRGGMQKGGWMQIPDARFLHVIHVSYVFYASNPVF